MRQRSQERAQTPETRHETAQWSRQTRTSKLVRIALFPAALFSVAFIASACGSGSPTPSSSANSDITQGLSAEKSGNTQQAISDFDSAAKENPTDPIPYYDLGVIYQLYLKNTTQAANEYNKAILASPSYKPALYNLAIVETSSNPQGAISLYQQLLKLNPNDPNVLFNLGLLLHANGQTTEGQQDIQKAVLLNPKLESRVPAGITP